MNVFLHKPLIKGNYYKRENKNKNHNKYKDFKLPVKSLVKYTNSILFKEITFMLTILRAIKV